MLLKYLLLAVAAFTTVMVVAVTAASFVLPGAAAEGPVLWSALRLAVALVIVGVGIATWRHFRSRATALTERLLLVGAMALLVAGSFGTAWAIHLGEVTGDYEYWAILIDLVLVGQGGLTILNLFMGRKAPDSHAI